LLLGPDPVPYPQCVTQMLAGQHLAMWTAMFQVSIAAPAALCPAEETADDQVQEGREAIEVDEGVRDLPKMEDPERPKRSWMLRWKTIGARRKTATNLLLLLLQRPRTTLI